MPDIVERATLRAHADMYITNSPLYADIRIQRLNSHYPSTATKGMRIKHIPRTSTVASPLTISVEFARFQSVKNKAPCKRLLICRESVFPTLIRRFAIYTEYIAGGPARAYYRSGCHQRLETWIDAKSINNGFICKYNDYILQNN